MNLSNKLTLIRIILVPVFVVFVLVPFPGNNWWATLIFVLASLTDLFDGYLARKRNEVTDFGKFLDPIADKILVISAFVCLVDLGSIPSWGVLIILAREFIVSGLRMAAASQNVVIPADKFGKLKTVSQMIAIIVLVSGILNVYFIPQILFYISVVLTFFSGLSYLLQAAKMKDTLLK